MWTDRRKGRPRTGQEMTGFMVRSVLAYDVPYSYSSLWLCVQMFAVPVSRPDCQLSKGGLDAHAHAVDS